MKTDGIDLVVHRTKEGGHDLEFCRAHKLEVCGKCHCNFSLTNAMLEIRNNSSKSGNNLSLNEIVQQTTKQVQENASSGKPPRKADEGAGGSDKLVLPRARVQSGIDLSSCASWTKGGDALQQAFRDTMSLMELYEASEEGSGMNDANTEISLQAEVKLVFHQLAEIYGKELLERNIRDPMFYGRLLLNEGTAKSEGLLIDILSVFCEPKNKANENNDVPIVAVRYAYSTAGIAPSLMEEYFHGLLPQGIERSHFMGGSDVSVRTIRQVTALLDQNRELLDPTWRQRLESKLPSGMKVSMIMPLEDYEAKASLDELVCPGCGREATRTCTRCRKQKYCSVQCQRAHWKKHKKVCKSVTTKSTGGEPHGRTAVVALDRKDPNDPFSSFESVALMSHKRPLGSASTFVQQGNQSKNAPKGIFIIKIQVAIFGYGSMFVYDRSHSFECFISDTNCHQAREIDAIIRQRGEAGGINGYFNAKVEDKKLVIYIDQLLGLFPW